MFMKVVDDCNCEYVQAGSLVKRYGVSRVTIWRLLNEMRAIKKYRHSFLDISFNLKLVKLKDFQQFMTERSEKYLRL